MACSIERGALHTSMNLLSLLQICQQLAKKNIWQLRSGALVGLKDGCFLQVTFACGCFHAPTLCASWQSWKALCFCCHYLAVHDCRRHTP